MSYRVFVVCEDHTLDQYVVLPIVSLMMSKVGKPRAIVKPVTNPRLHGISEVEREFEALAKRYTAIGDLVIFALDRDGMDGKNGRRDRAAAFSERLARLEASVRNKVKVVLAVEETEVWALWGVRHVIGANWSAVRRDRDPKEAYFYPMTTQQDLRAPGAGRVRLTALSVAQGWDSLVTGCPELATLASDVEMLLAD